MPRHPPNTLETLDRSHLQRPTPDAPSLDGLTGRGPERRTSSAFCYPVSTTERSWGPDRSRGHDECHGTSPDRARPVITLFTMSNSHPGYPRPAPAGPRPAEAIPVSAIEHQSQDEKTENELHSDPKRPPPTPGPPK